MKGPHEWADEVAVWCVDTLLIDLFLPEGVCDKGLRDAVCSEGGVEPGCSAVTDEFGPVALYCW